MSASVQIIAPNQENKYTLRQRKYYDSEKEFYKVLDKNNKERTMKIVDIQKLNKSYAYNRIQQAQKQLQLSSNFIVKVQKRFSIGEKCYQVMQHCQNNLQDYLKKNKLTISQKIKSFTQIVMCYQELHNKKVLHRFVCARNIMVISSQSKLKIKITEFGYAKKLTNHQQPCSLEVGNMYYRSPQILNSQIYTSKTDIWSLGVLLYYMLFARYPWQGNNCEQILQNINTKPIIYEEDTPQLLKLLLQSMLQKNQSTRISWQTLFRVFMGQLPIIDGMQKKLCEKKQQFIKSLPNIKKSVNPISQSKKNKQEQKQIIYPNKFKQYQTKLQPLGEGCFGKVYEATKPCLLAIKEVKIPDRQYYKQRLEEQINLMKEVKHKNVVRLYKHFQQDKKQYLVLEYCQSTLTDYLKKNLNLTLKKKRQIFVQILTGYSELYRLNIIHRDIKTDNILVNNGQFKIADFGFAKKYKNQQVLKSCVGTPLFSPPQLFVSQKSGYTSKADIWSLGSLYYFMIYNDTPFSAQNKKELYDKLLNKNVQFPSEPNNVDFQTKYIILRMLQKKQQNRCTYEFLFDFFNIKIQKKQIKQNNEKVTNVADLKKARSISSQKDLISAKFNKKYN